MCARTCPLKCAILSALLLSPALTLAAESNNVMIFPIQPVYETAPEDAAGAITVVLNTELASTDRIRVVPAPKLQRTAAADGEDGAAADRAAVSRAIGLVATAAGEIRAQDYDKALKLLKGARRDLEVAAERLDDLDPLIRCYLNMSMAYFGSGEEESGEELINHVVRLDPARRLDPAEFPPLFLRIFHARRIEIYRQPRGSVLVQTVPPGAAISLDGRPVGSTPLVLKGLIRGEHFVKIERAGEAPRCRRVSVPSGSQVEVKVGLSGGAAFSGSAGAVADGIRNNRLDAITRDRAAQMARNAGADYVIVGGLTRSTGMYQVNMYFIKAATAEITPLVPIFLDADLLGASIEVYKAAEEVVKKVEAFPEAMKQPVVRVIPGIAAPEEKTTVVHAGPDVDPPPLPQIEPAAAKDQPLPVQNGRPKDAEPRDPDGLEPTFGPDRAPLAAPVPVGRVDVDLDPRPWYKNPWLWAAVGVVVVGTTVGTALYVTSISPDHGDVVMKW